MIDRPKDDLGRFMSPNPEPLADKALSVRLPVSIDALIRSLPSDQRADWLRRVLGEAAKQELLGERPFLDSEDNSEQSK